MHQSQHCYTPSGHLLIKLWPTVGNSLSVLQLRCLWWLLANVKPHLMGHLLTNHMWHHSLHKGWLIIWSSLLSPRIKHSIYSRSLPSSNFSFIFSQHSLIETSPTTPRFVKRFLHVLCRPNPTLRQHFRYAKCLLAMQSANLYYKSVEGEISFTFNTWTSDPSQNFILVTAHFIDSPKDWPDQWAPREIQLAFALLEGHPTGANIASVLQGVLDRYDICEKVCIVFILCTSANDLQLLVRMVYCQQCVQQQHGTKSIEGSYQSW